LPILTRLDYLGGRLPSNHNGAVVSAMGVSLYPIRADLEKIVDAAARGQFVILIPIAAGRSWVQAPLAAPALANG
jgi:hypothetical protein